MERQLTFRSVLRFFLENARWIILVTAICTIAVLLFAVFSQSDTPAPVMAELERANSLDQKMGMLQMQIGALQKQKDTSIFLQLDPYGTQRVEISFAILPIKNQAELKEIDYLYLDTVTSSFYYFMTDDAVYAELRAVMEIDESVLREEIYKLVTMSADSSTHTVRIVTYHNDENIALRMAETIYAHITKQAETVYGNFKLVPLATMHATVTENRIIEENLAIENEVRDLNNNIAEVVKERALIGSVAPSPLLPRLIKFGILGLTLGFVLSLAIMFFFAVINDRISCKQDISLYVHLPVYGAYASEQKKRRLLQPLIDQLFWETDTMEYILSTIRLSLSDDHHTLLLCGDGSEKQLQTLAEKIEANLGVRVLSGKNILFDARSLQQLNETDSVILSAVKGKTTFDGLDQQKERIKLSGANVQGVILLL